MTLRRDRKQPLGNADIERNGNGQVPLALEGPVDIELHARRCPLAVFQVGGASWLEFEPELASTCWNGRMRLDMETLTPRKLYA